MQEEKRIPLESETTHLTAVRSVWEAILKCYSRKKGG